MEPPTPPPPIPALNWKQWEKPESLYTHLEVSTLQTRSVISNTVAGPPHEEIPTPSSPGFLPSAGVLLSTDRTSATLQLEKPQVLVSRSWISPSHENKTREWRVEVCGDVTNGFGAYVGITYATSFDTPGFTLVFDSNGNAQFDTTPSLLGFVHEYKHRHSTGMLEDEATTFDGCFPVEQKSNTFVVVLHTDTRILEVRVSKKSCIKAKLDAFVEGCSWNEARLAVYLQPGTSDQRKVKLLSPS